MVTADDALHLTPREVAQVDPADIRPGDVVRVVEEFEVEDCDDGTIFGGGFLYSGEMVTGRTWHLVHRPDPDAEAVEVMESIGMTYVRTYLDELRRRGWDVVRRVES